MAGEPYTLKYPVVTRFQSAAGGEPRTETISEITLRKGKARDLMVTDGMTGATAKSIALIAQLGNLTRKQVGELDCEDFAVLDGQAFSMPEKPAPLFVGGGEPIPLTAPLTVRAGEGEGVQTDVVSEITLRRARAKDGLVVDALEGRVAQTLALIGALSGYSPADLGELESADFYTVGSRAWGFTPSDLSPSDAPPGP